MVGFQGSMCGGDALPAVTVLPRGWPGSDPCRARGAGCLNAPGGSPDKLAAFSRLHILTRSVQRAAPIDNGADGPQTPLRDQEATSAKQKADGPHATKVAG